MSDHLANLADPNSPEASLVMAEQAIREREVSIDDLLRFLTVYEEPAFLNRTQQAKRFAFADALMARFVIIKRTGAS